MKTAISIEISNRAYERINEMDQAYESTYHLAFKTVTQTQLCSQVENTTHWIVLTLEHEGTKFDTHHHMIVFHKLEGIQYETSGYSSEAPEMIP